MRNNYKAHDHYLSGIMNLTDLNLNEAINDFSKAIEADVNYIEAYKQRGIIFCLLKKYHEGIADFNHVLMYESNNITVLKHRARAYYLINDFKSGFRDLTSVLNLNPNDAESLYERGYRLINEEKYNEAINDLSKSILIEPNYEHAYLKRGLALAFLSRMQEAMSDFNKAIKLNPLDTEAYTMRGFAYESLGNDNEAINDYNKAIEIDSENWKAYGNRALILFKRFEYDKALRDYNKAIEINNYDTFLLNNRGMVNEKIGNVNNAIKDFIKAINISPDNYQVYNNLGMTYLRIADWNTAIKYCDEALTINPDNTPTYINRAIAENRLGRKRKALNDFNRAISLEPDWAYAYFKRAVEYYLYNNNYINAFQDFVIVEELCSKDDDLFEFGSDMLKFFKSFDAPFFINRLIKRLSTLDTYLSYSDLIQKNLENCLPIIDILDYVQEKQILSKSLYELYKGTIIYYMNDPSVCYHLFDEQVDMLLPDNLMGQFYFILSCQNYLRSEKKSISKSALAMAKKYLTENERSGNYTQLYYAGQIFFISNEYGNALQCFSLIDDFIPALCMEINCLSIMKDERNRNIKISELLVLENHNKGLLQFSYIPSLSIDNFEDSVLRYCYMREIEGVIPILCNVTLEIENLLRTEYNDLALKPMKLFAIDVNDIEGRSTIDAIFLWKKEIINKLCENLEIIFNKSIRDSFIIWSNEANKVLLEIQLASFFHSLSKGKYDEFSPIDLVDYFILKEKLNYEARYLLIGWVEMLKYKNQRLSEFELKSIKYSFGFLVKIAIGYFGITELGLLPTIVIYFGEQLSKDFITGKITKFIESILDKNIPIESYSEFKDKFLAYLKVTED